MSAIVTHDGRIVTINDEIVTYELQAAIEASGPTPTDRTVTVESESRVVTA